MKKTNYMKIFRRILLCAVLVAVSITLLVFFLDKYDSANKYFENKYPDDYWKSETIEGFEYYEDIDGRTDKFNILKEEYVAPWDKNDGDLEKVLASRYQEELDTVTKDLKVTLNKYDRQIKKVYEQGWHDGIEAWILEYIYLEKADYEGTAATGTAYDVAKKYGYTKTLEEFHDLLDNADDDFTFYLEDDGFTGEEDQYKELAKALLTDTIAIKVIEKYDVEEYNRLVSESEPVRNVVNKAIEVRQELPNWIEYRKKDLLGFGSLATDYASKPVFTTKTPAGTYLEFWFNSYLTTFKVVEKDSSDNEIQTWYSNPEVKDENVNEEIKASQETIINLSYAVLKGETNSFSNYTYSVRDFDKGNSMDLVPQYAVKIDKETKTLSVWYKLGKRGIDYTYFPYQFSKARLQEFLDRNDKLHAENPLIPDIDAPENLKKYYAPFTQSIYKIIKYNDPNNKYKDDTTKTNDEKEYYEIDGVHKNMSGLSIQTLNEILYQFCGYTEEDLVLDNAQFGNETQLIKAEFSLAIEYTLTENGLTVNVPGNSIIESKDFPVTKISILPYFTASVEGTEGYTVIPDGSGAVMKHDNGNTAFPKYTKRVYSEDLATVSFINKGQTNDLMFPMYSVVNTGTKSGILAYATGNTPQLELTADISGRDDNYNKSFFTVYLREFKNITIGSSNYAQQLVKWTGDRVYNDTVINYTFLHEDELNYSAVAHKYRNIIEKLYDITPHDNTKKPVLDMTVLGSYSFTDNFIGIPYKKYDVLTTAEELQQMIDLFSGDEYGIDYINAYYLGWRKQGFENLSFEKMKVSKLVGSKALFNNLLTGQAEGINIYPYLSFGEVNKIQESFGKVHYVTHQVDGDFSIRWPYDLNNNTFNKQLDKILAISPRYYEAFGNSLAKSYGKATNNFSNLALDKIGNQVTGDYKRKVETFRIDGLYSQLNVFNNLADKGITNLALYAPYDFAFKYANSIKDVPYQSTLYEIFDYSIPFYQLVLNGLVDYSGESINALSEKGLNEHIMRIIETGSNIAFTLSYDSSEKLLQTDYNEYFYTYYGDWLPEIKEAYTILSELGIYACDFTSHEMVDNNVFKVTYTSDTEVITIVLNYTRSDFVYEGVTIPAKSYKKVN